MSYWAGPYIIAILQLLVDIGLWYIYYSNASIVGSGTKFYNDTEVTAGNWSKYWCVFEIDLWLTGLVNIL